MKNIYIHIRNSNHDTSTVYVLITDQAWLNSTRLGSIRPGWLLSLSIYIERERERDLTVRTMILIRISFMSNIFFLQTKLGSIYVEREREKDLTTRIMTLMKNILDISHIVLVTDQAGLYGDPLAARRRAPRPTPRRRTWQRSSRPGASWWRLRSLQKSPRLLLQFTRKPLDCL